MKKEGGKKTRSITQGRLLIPKQGSHHVLRVRDKSRETRVNRDSERDDLDGSDANI